MHILRQTPAKRVPCCAGVVVPFDEFFSCWWPVLPFDEFLPYWWQVLPFDEFLLSLTTHPPEVEPVELSELTDGLCWSMSVTVHVPDEDSFRSIGGAPGRPGLACGLTVTDRGTNTGFLTAGDGEAVTVGIDLPAGLDGLAAPPAEESLSLLLSSSP